MRAARAEPFRRFVFQVFAERLADLMGLVEAVAFQRLDQRLAAALLGHGTVVHAAHQALADQLGTAREIVTRLLNRFELAGLVRLSRERIEVVDAPALRAHGPDRCATAQLLSQRKVPVTRVTDRERHADETASDAASRSTSRSPPCSSPMSAPSTASLA